MSRRGTLFLCSLVLAGCQLVSGLDDLHVGTGGAGGAGGGSTTDTTSTTTATTNTTTGSSCGMPADTCAAADCAGNCESNVCKVSCPDGANVCDNPPADDDLPCVFMGKDAACEFDCSPPTPTTGAGGGVPFGSCAGRTIKCPPNHRCDVVCTGMGACVDMTVECPIGDAPCTLTCSDAACSDATTKLVCGGGLCQADCSMTQPPQIDQTTHNPCQVVDNCHL
jgi:hypothetical protein